MDALCGIFNVVGDTVQAWKVQDWAAAATIAGIVFALLQYIGTSRANARAHMHSVFRDYLAIRMANPPADEQRIIGYRYYAIEEVFTWLEKERARRRLLLRMKKCEYTSWMYAIDHHIRDGVTDQQSLAYKYFNDRQLLFGVNFRKHVRGVLDRAVKNDNPPPTPVLQAGKATATPTASKPEEI